jgi:hypothetical protein
MSSRQIWTLKVPSIVFVLTVIAAGNSLGQNEVASSLLTEYQKSLQ